MPPPFNPSSVVPQPFSLSPSIPLLMQHPFQPRRVDGHHIRLHNTVGNEDEFLVIYLTANKITYPELIIQMKYIGQDRLYYDMLASRYFREKVP